MRARRRQCRKNNLQPPLTYRLDASLPLVCDPNCKFNLPRFQMAERQRAIGRITANLQAAMRSSMARCLPYRGTNVSRYTPTSQRPKGPERRHNGIWQKEQSPRADTKPSIKSKNKESNKKGNTKTQENINNEKIEENEIEKKESNECVEDDQEPSTSKACTDMGLQKRLYSTVLSMNPIGQVGARLTQKLITPGILKLNPKILLPRLRQTNVDSRFEELEKQALEQYKASDESIDTKFQELEKQAEEQYSNSNSNTSCSSAEKKPSDSSAITERSLESQKSKSVDSVVVYSQKYPELKLSSTSIGKRLKNVHSPLRGETKDISKVKIIKSSDKKDKIRWISHILPPKKRHECMTDFSSDEEFDGCANSPCEVCDKRKVKMSAHGGGDLKNIMMRNS